MGCVTSGHLQNSVSIRSLNTLNSTSGLFALKLVLVFFFLNRISAKCWAQSLFMFWWSENVSFLPARLETSSLLPFSWIRACNFFKPAGNKLVCILSFHSSWDHQQRCEFYFVIHCQMHPFIWKNECKHFLEGASWEISTLWLNDHLYSSKHIIVIITLIFG